MARSPGGEDGVASPLVWRLTALMAAGMFLLTAADIATTLHVLDGGGIELNTYARDGAGGLHVEFLVLINICVLLPLVLCFYVALRHAGRVPASVLDNWWRHLVDFFSARPGSAIYKGRAPLRLAAAALTMLIFKGLTVFSNVLGALGLASPATLVGWAFADAGFDGLPLWRAVYAVMIVPCYIAAVWLASLTLRTVKHDMPIIAEGPAE